MDESLPRKVSIPAKALSRRIDSDIVTGVALAAA
jgi:hypothetical protein